MAKRLFLMLGLVVLAVTVLAYVKVMQIKTAIAMGAKFAPPPPAVSTVVVKGEKWQPTLSAVGSLKAVNGVLVTTDLAGIISEITFDSGLPVKKGEVLVKLDTKQELAQLRSAEARLDLARATLNRQDDLLAKKASSQAEFDSAKAEARQAEAHMEEIRALIERKTIAAPFDGLLGIRQVNVGQYLNVGSPVAPLQSLDPIYVEFNVPQQNLDKIAKGGKVLLKAAGLAEQVFQGEITAIDSRLDETSRNIQIQGTIRNPAQRLRPGMFASVEVLLPEQDGVLAVPASSISYSTFGDSVFIVRDQAGPDGKDGKDAKDGKPGKIVKQQFIKTGATRGDQVAVVSGIKAGDEVVSSGVFKLRSNQPVRIDNSVQPSNQANPRPPES